jgi:hypothetical protein
MRVVRLATRYVTGVRAPVRDFANLSVSWREVLGDVTTITALGVFRQVRILPASSNSPGFA